MFSRNSLFIGIISLFVLLAGCSADVPIETNMSEKVNDFSFTNQAGESVSLDDLQGDWWLADFVFTNCKTVCLPMTSNMASLQEQMAEENIDIQLVSFSVDPDYDTEDVLKEYGKQYDADFSSWHFLTGYDFDTIKKLSIKSFRAMLKEPDYGDDQVMHDTRFFLVNPEGEVIKGYDGVDKKNIDVILKDIQLLNKDGLL